MLLNRILSVYKTKEINKIMKLLIFLCLLLAITNCAEFNFNDKCFISKQSAIVLPYVDGNEIVHKLDNTKTTHDINLDITILKQKPEEEFISLYLSLYILPNNLNASLNILASSISCNKYNNDGTLSESIFPDPPGDLVIIQDIDVIPFNKYFFFDVSLSENVRIKCKTNELFYIKTSTPGEIQFKTCICHLNNDFSSECSECGLVPINVTKDVKSMFTAYNVDNDYYLTYSPNTDYYNSNINLYSNCKLEIVLPYYNVDYFGGTFLGFHEKLSIVDIDSEVITNQFSDVRFYFL